MINQQTWYDELLEAWRDEWRRVEIRSKDCPVIADLILEVAGGAHRETAVDKHSSDSLATDHNSSTNSARASSSRRRENDRSDLSIVRPDSVVRSRLRETRDRGRARGKPGGSDASVSVA